MITVKVSELLKIVTELKDDNIEYVDISILEKEKYNEEIIPASLHFSGYDGEGGGYDYEAIEGVEISATYKLKKQSK